MTKALCWILNNNLDQGENLGQIIFVFVDLYLVLSVPMDTVYSIYSYSGCIPLQTLIRDPYCNQLISSKLKAQALYVLIKN